MKLIREYSDASAAETVSDRLRNRGVMTVVLGKKIRNLPILYGGATHVGLWVVFDDQVEDGVQLLENRKHIPKREITVAEMERFELSAEKNLTSIGRRLFGRVASILGMALIVLFVGRIIWSLKGAA